MDTTSLSRATDRECRWNWSTTLWVITLANNQINERDARLRKRQFVESEAAAAGSQTFAVFVQFQRLGDVLERFAMMMLLLRQHRRSRTQRVTAAADRRSSGSAAWRPCRSQSSHLDDGWRRRRRCSPRLSVGSVLFGSGADLDRLGRRLRPRSDYDGPDAVGERQQ